MSDFVGIRQVLTPFILTAQATSKTKKQMNRE